MIIAKLKTEHILQKLLNRKGFGQKKETYRYKDKENLPESLIYAPYSMPYTNFALLVKGIIQPIATKEHKYRNTDFGC